MRAKEYIEKYSKLKDENISISRGIECINALYADMLDEMKCLLTARRISSKSAFKSLLKEFNIKGNRMCEAFHLRNNWFLLVFSQYEETGKELLKEIEEKK